MDEIGIENARATLGEIVDLARIAGRPTRITRQGKPAAVLVSAGWFDRAGALLSELGNLHLLGDDLDSLSELEWEAKALRAAVFASTPDQPEQEER